MTELPLQKQSISQKNAMFIIVLVVLLVFGRLTLSEFTNWDDEGTLAKNELMLPPTLHTIQYYFTHADMSIYMPMTYVFWSAIGAMAAYPNISGGLEDISLNSWLFHGFNVIAHATAGIMVFMLIQSLIRDRVAALLGALLWALHPVQVETVGWASGLKDVLAGTFSFLALWQFTTFRTTSSPTKAKRAYIISCTALAFALLSKPSAMTTLLLVIALDWVCFQTPIKKMARDIWPWAIMVLPIAIIAKYAQPAPATFATPIYLRPLLAGDSITFYLSKIVWPAQLCMDYGRRPQWVIENGWLYYTWIPAAILIAFTIMLLRKAPLLALGLVVFILAPVHVLGLTKFDFQFYSTVADHYLYVSSLGFGIVFAWVAHRYKSRAMILFLSIILVGLGIRSFVQTATWYDTESLMKHAIAVNPRSFVARNNLATQSDDSQNMIDMLEKMESVEPNAVFIEKNLMNAYINVGKFDEARKRAEKNVELSLKFSGAESLATCGLYMNIAEHFYEAGQLEDAQHYANLALKINPSDRPALRIIRQIKLHQKPTTQPQ